MDPLQRATLVLQHNARLFCGIARHAAYARFAAHMPDTARARYCHAAAFLPSAHAHYALLRHHATLRTACRTAAAYRLPRHGMPPYTGHLPAGRTTAVRAPPLAAPLAPSAGGVLAPFYSAYAPARVYLRYLSGTGAASLPSCVRKKKKAHLPTLLLFSTSGLRRWLPHRANIPACLHMLSPYARQRALPSRSLNNGALLTRANAVPYTTYV